MYNVCLNPYLVAAQNLSRVDVAILHELHAKKDVVFEKAEGNRDIDALVAELRVIEFKMQRVWGFTLNGNRHTWKYLMPNSPYLADLHDNLWATRYLHGMLSRQGDLGVV